MQNEIFDFIRSIDGDCRQSDRTVLRPYEIDVFSEKRKLGFEFDGLYWHSDENKPKDYHLIKTEECEKRGIQLIHIFENEWIHKKEIVKSRVKNLFGIFDKTVFARKCSVREIDFGSSKAFQNKNHIQGNASASVSIGLFFNDELVSLMTFSKCRFDRTHEWELVRFCNKLGYHIPGGASRLLKYFEKNYKPSSLVSYADRRWSQGKLYRALGFRLDHISKPDYWYFKNRTDIIYSRLNFQKHKLKDKLENFDPKKSEYENMKNNGYNRIYDCGNMVFVKTFKTCDSQD